MKLVNQHIDIIILKTDKIAKSKKCNVHSLPPYHCNSNTIDIGPVHSMGTSQGFCYFKQQNV